MVSSAIVFHLPVYLVYVYSFTYDVINITVGWESYGGKFKFLTFICMIIQTLYFGLCVANDLCGSDVKPSEGGKKDRSRLQRWRDNFLTTVVFPLGMFVVLTFWGLYAVDRELVYPKRLDAIIPSWLNHIMHTTILPFLLVDIFLVYHRYPSRKAGFTTLISLALIYLLWILWIAYRANIWVYPILKVLPPHQKAIFIVAMLFVFIIIYLIGELMNKTLWGKERAELQKMKSQ